MAKQTMPPILVAFDGRTDLKRFGPASLLLYALQLKYGVEDLDAIAATSLTEGSTDKKSDLIYIDADSGIAVIAQSYKSQKPGKKEAKANKAGDLNTAIAWLLNSPIDDLPPEIKTHAIELRKALKENSIRTLKLWYVHNAYESVNVERELKTVEHSAKTVISKKYPETIKIDIHATEIGINTLSGWFDSIKAPIMVKDPFTVTTQGGYETSGIKWKALVTSIPAKLLYTLYQVYKAKLFSANVRDYLGSRNKDENINSNIKNTAENDPANFWVFNNGITALTNKYTYDDAKKIFHIEGLSIVNGAQTTGALGSLASPPTTDAWVPIRLITCSDKETIRNIIKYNNSQNPTAVQDFRSSDAVQTKLEKEFSLISGVEYAARRGGYEDIIKRRPNLIPSTSAGQALAAFHQEPGIAYHKKSSIWVDDSLYGRFFNEHTTARHILLAFSLIKAIEQKKWELIDKDKSGRATENEKKQLVFFRNRGSIILMASAVAKSIDTLLDSSIPNRLRLIFKTNISLKKATLKWGPIINALSPLVEHLLGGFSDGLNNRTAVDKAINDFSSIVASTKLANKALYSSFTKDISF